MARNGNCTLPPELATALANALRAYLTGRWNDTIPIPRATAIQYDKDPPGITLQQTLTRQDMQHALTHMKLFAPTEHRTLLAALGNRLDPNRAKTFYLALCTLWKYLVKTLEK